MTETAIHQYRRQLLALKKRLGKDLTALEQEALRAAGEAAGNLSNVPLHPADLGTETHEEEVSVGLLENEAQLLIEVNDALDRIERGTFGRCEECGKEITRRRLEVIPYARYCIEDAQKLQSKLPR
jgi:RNA polymerase-binding protein DksA